MKDQKSLSHNDLLKMLFEHLKFPIEASQVKLRLESLIERDYLKRSSENAAVYEYIA